MLKNFCQSLVILFVLETFVLFHFFDKDLLDVGRHNRTSVTVEYAEDGTIVAEGQLRNVRVLLRLAPALHARGSVAHAIVLSVLGLLDSVWLTQIGSHLCCKNTVLGFCVCIRLVYFDF